jgi:hypothetical protein
VRDLGPLWDIAAVFGGLSVVAHAIARHSWTTFEAALKEDLTCDTGTHPLMREWDFRY